MPLKYADVQKQYEKNKDLKKADINVLQEWHRKQPHLPPITELEFIFALHSCYYSIERAKATLENYFTIRTATPEFFGHMNPILFQNCLNTVAIIPLPKVTGDDYLIIYCKLVNTDPTAFDFCASIKYLDSIGEMWVRENGTVEGIVGIVDMKGFSFAHISKLSLLELRKGVTYLQEALLFRLKGIHGINTPSFIDRFIAILKPYMKRELFNLIHFHTDKLEKLYEHVPQELLPKDFGGTLESVEHLHDATKKKINENADFIASQEIRLVDESKRQGRPVDVDALFGIEGSFKKLDID